VFIVDNHDDFGGHAKRNEFSYKGRTFIGYGGTMGIATPYPYSYDSLGDPDMPPEQRPHVVGRQRFGSVAIANADAGAAAFTNQAIDEAHRAVQELLMSHGLT
jgi:hypothetical protein